MVERKHAEADVGQTLGLFAELGLSVSLFDLSLNHVARATDTLLRNIAKGHPAPFYLFGELDK